MGTKLLVSNLPLNVDASTLEDMFTLVGDVQTARVDFDALTGESLGIGHVEMASSQQAQDVIEHFNGHNARGRILIVREDKPHVPRVKPTTKAASRRLLNANRKRR